MPVITSANSLYGAGTLLTVDNDTLDVNVTGFLFSTGSDHAVVLETVSEATVNGLINNNGASAVAALVQTEDVDLDLTVGESGVIHGRVHAFIANYDTDIWNYGTMSAGAGDALVLKGEGAYYIDNYGLISSNNHDAMEISGGGIHTINNYGVISALNLFAIRSTSAAATDSVGNFGTIRGNIILGGGDDNYDGEDGVLTGTLYLGFGDDEADGGSAADKFEGGDQDDRLNGNGGADTLTGGGHNDRITGGGAIDTITGGTGNDIFIFNVGLAFGNRDTIMDFNVGNDTAHLENAIFKKVGPLGTLKAAAFRKATQALDDSDRIIYDKASGALSYDPDGVGGAAQKVFAIVDNNATLTAADFRVI